MSQFCTFLLQEEYFGVPVEQVQEVIRHQEMTRVPLVPEAVRGLINLRGQIVMAVDLRRLLGMPERPASQLPINIVVRTDDGAVSFLVDEIGDVIDVDGNGIEPPETVRGRAREMIRGIYRLDGQLMRWLDISATCRVGEGE